MQLLEDGPQNLDEWTTVYRLIIGATLPCRVDILCILTKLHTKINKKDKNSLVSS